MKQKEVLKLEAGDVIKHKAFIDVCIQVTFLDNDPEEDEVIIHGIWFNQGQIESYLINTEEYPFGVPCYFKINRKNLDKWFKCTEPTAKFLREATWESLV